jgi:tetratricopeptide (TPR) repeat protein
MLGIFSRTLPATVPRPLTGAVTELCLSLPEPPPGDRTAAEYLRTLDRCSTLLSTDAELQARLGAAYESVGNLALAESAYRQALAIDTAYADVGLRLGRLMVKRGASDEAQEQARAALLIQPNRRALLDLLHQSAGSGRRR